MSCHMHSICLRFNGVTGVHTVNTVPHKWGESPSPLKHFNIYVQLSLHTFLPCMMERWKAERGEGEHRVAQEEVNWDSISISVLLRMDSAGFPVALLWPQCLKFFNVWTLRGAETYFTLITQYWYFNKLQYVFSTWAICTLFGSK